VLLDAAYAEDSLTVSLGERLLRQETGLHGRSLEPGRDWLMEAGFVSYESRPGVRTTYTLVLPQVPGIAGQSAKASGVPEIAGQPAKPSHTELPGELPGKAPGIAGHESESDPRTLIEEEVPRGREGTKGETDDEKFLDALGLSANGASPTPVVGEIVDCSRHGPRLVVQVTAGIAYLRCGCQARAVERASRA
jgi:hypothetical protein